MTCCSICQCKRIVPIPVPSGFNVLLHLPCWRLSENDWTFMLWVLNGIHEGLIEPRAAVAPVVAERDALRSRLESAERRIDEATRRAYLDYEEPNDVHYGIGESVRLVSSAYRRGRSDMRSLMCAALAALETTTGGGT